MKKQVVNKEIAMKVLNVVRKGLSCGLGEPEPGKMCVEAAVCYAYGLPHNDNPPCVGEAVRSFKIALNDSGWSSVKARGKGMLGIAIAQLGSEGINQKKFTSKLAIKTVQRILPPILGKIGLTKEALLCKKVKTPKQARKAAADAADAYADAYAAADAAATYAAAKAAAEATKLAPKKDPDRYLKLSAQLCLEVLKEMKSPGTKYLYLLNKK